VRLLLANPYFLPFEGGIEARMDGLARGLAARGHEVGVLTSRLPGTAEEERRDGYRVLRVPAWVWRSFPYNPPPVLARGIGAALEAWDPDVADFQYRWARGWTRAMGAWARRHPTVFTWHNPWGEGVGLVGLASGANDARFAPALRHVRRVVCISEAVQRDLARRLPHAALTTIHAGFHPPPPLPRTDGDFALFTGRLVATKGLDVLLEAMARAPEVRVVVVGKGPLLGALQAQARRLGLQGRVRFAGFVPEEEKQRLMAACRFVVHPARWEGLGHALAEAMLHGKGVVASDVGGIPEVVGAGGVLVPPGDAPALAGAMRDLWADAALRAALGQKAEAHARTFTWERCVARTEQVYRDALGEAVG
jgi:glycosyltransferase involved in cell wall biosynthesis